MPGVRSAFLEKFWGDCPLDIFLLTNELEVRSPRLRSHRGRARSRLVEQSLRALERIAHPYVLYFQEDYFLTAPVDRAQLARDFAQVIKVAPIRFVSAPAPSRSRARSR